MDSPFVVETSECFIKPQHLPEESKQPLYLSPWDLVCNTSRRVSFSPSLHLSTAMKKWKIRCRSSTTLSLALFHFYPLAGRLATLKQDDHHDPPIYTIYVDCTNSPRARFLHTSLDLTADDIISPTTDAPEIVRSFFDHDGALNHDGHFLSLLSIKVTQFKDGIFIGCSANHMVVDGTSFWHFLNTWSEIFNGNGENVSISGRARPDSQASICPPGSIHPKTRSATVEGKDFPFLIRDDC